MRTGEHVMIILALLCAISANVDTIGVSIALGTKKITIKWIPILIATTVQAAGTLISMLLGKFISSFFSQNVANIISGLLLIGIGIYFIYEYYLRIRREKHNMLDSPEIADKNQNYVLDNKEAFALGLALTINNIGVGIAAAMAGINIYINVIATFAICIFGLFICTKIARQFAVKINEKLSTYICSGIIIAIGAFALFGL